jgi:hypothetical protein
MQTFLPYSDFKKSLESLDNKRLGKQRVETFQILNAILGRPKKDGTAYKGWLNHPCSIMWKNYTDALKLYFNTSLIVWVDRGFSNTMEPEDLNTNNVVYPHWLGFEEFHSSHRANLLRKDFNYYSEHGWLESPKDPYVWLDKENKWYKQEVGVNKKIYFG